MQNFIVCRVNNGLGPFLLLYRKPSRDVDIELSVAACHMNFRVQKPSGKHTSAAAALHAHALH